MALGLTMSYEIKLYRLAKSSSGKLNGKFFNLNPKRKYIKN